MQLVELWRAACLVNESDEKSWFKLGDSGMDGCGLSFGVNQFDLHSNDSAAAVLGRVLRVAKAAKPGLAITLEQITAIEAGALKAPAKEIVAGTPAAALAPLVDEALATVAGRAALTKESDGALKADVAFLGGWGEGLANTLGSRDLVGGDRLAQLLLLDFFNLFGRPTKITLYLQGQAVALNNGTNHPDPIVAPASASDLFRYILLTKQGFGTEPDQRAEILRRMNNIVHLARPEAGWPPWPEKDQVWFAEGLAAVLSPAAGPIAQKRQAGLYDDLLGLAGLV